LFAVTEVRKLSAPAWFKSRISRRSFGSVKVGFFKVVLGLVEVSLVFEKDFWAAGAGVTRN
jgi:hypothetical protein